MLSGGEFYRIQVRNLLTFCRESWTWVIRIEARRERFRKLRVQISLEFDQYVVLR